MQVGDKLGLQVDQKSGEVVTAGIASTLLAQLLRVAASGEVYALCCRLLSYIDERAAAANDYSKLFASEERFPDVFRWVGSGRTAVTGAVGSGRTAVTDGLAKRSDSSQHDDLDANDDVLGGALPCLAASANLHGGCPVHCARPNATPPPPCFCCCRCQRNVVAAEQHLQQLLPQLARTAGVRKLEYRSVQNQGDYLIELPAERKDVPRGWERVTTTKKVCR